jgi:mannosyltransferase
MPSTRAPAPAPAAGAGWKILALILLLSAAARVHGIGRDSLWFDEAATVHIVRQPLGRMLELIESDERTPPLHYLLLHFWIKLFGDSEISLRLPSAIAGVAAVYVLYRLVRALLGMGAGLVAAFIFAINRYQIAYSQEARAYELMVLAGLISTCLFVRIMRRRAPRAQGIYALVTAGLLYCHLYGIFVLVAHHIAWAFARLRKRSMLSPRRWALLNLAVLALFSPWIRISVRWARDVQQSFWIPPLHPVDLFMTYRAYAGSTAMLILLAALALLGLRRAAHRRALALLAALALLPVVVPIAMSILTRPTFTPRYGLIAAAGWIALAAGGVIALPNRPLRAGTLAAIAFFAAIATLPPIDKPQWREAGAWLESHMQSSDVAVISRKNSTYLYDYYVHRPDVRRFGFDGSAIPVTLPLPPGQHVWLILHANLAPRAAILARGGWKTVRSQAFHGIQILELSDPTEPAVHP